MVCRGLLAASQSTVCCGGAFSSHAPHVQTAFHRPCTSRPAASKENLNATHTGNLTDQKPCIRLKTRCNSDLQEGRVSPGSNCVQGKEGYAAVTVAERKAGILT